MGLRTYWHNAFQVNSESLPKASLTNDHANVPEVRFTLRFKIAGFAAALVVLATSLVAVFTVILPWRAKLRAQDRVANQIVRTVLPLGIDLRADGAHFDGARVQQLVADSGGVEGVTIVYALLFDEQGRLDEHASAVNAALLARLAPELAPEPSALIHRPRVAGLRWLPIHLETPQHDRIGRLELGLSTKAIDAELRRSLRRDAAIFAATLLFAILSALFFAGRIAQPLTDLAKAMGRVRGGDFDVDPPRLSRHDEVGELSHAFGEMAQGLRERERLKGTLGRYVSGDVAERILSESSDLELAGELRRVTVLFLDVRGFTSLSEKLRPQEVLELLNTYFHVVVDRVAFHGGVVNKFMGDAALCVWGAPREAAEPERVAVICALEIQREAERLTQERVRKGLPGVQLGIGINSGEAVAGNLGAAQRLEYTVIGDAVNVAQRIEAQARGGEVLISQSVQEKLPPGLLALAREPVKLKGIAQPVQLWEVKLAAAATEAA
jgi:class 3 adenylate cyclase